MSTVCRNFKSAMVAAWNPSMLNDDGVSSSVLIQLNMECISQLS